MDGRQVKIVLALAVALFATVAHAQCATGVSDNAQNFCGAKTFADGTIIGYNGGDYPGLVVRGGGVWLDGVYSGVQVVPGGGAPVYMRDDVPIGSLAPSFLFETRRARTGSDPVLMIRRAGAGGAPVVIFTLLADGTINTGTIVTNGHSGDPSLFASKNYVGLAGDFPPHYQGEHGAVSISTTNPCENEAFNLLQASDGKSGIGARTDYTFNVTCLGGRYSRRPPSSYSLPRCNNGLGEPPEPNNRYGNCSGLVEPLQGNFGLYGPQTDGGYCYDWTTYYGPDGGMAKNGTVFDFVEDVGEGCQCVSTKYDGGSSPAGWFKLSDRSECRP